MSSAPILVAGKSGQLGQCLLEAAGSRSLRIVLAGRPNFDIERREFIDQFLGAVSPALIINGAAYTAVDKAEAESERCYAVNRDGAAELAAAAWRRGVPFIHISTDYVFDGKKTSPYHEDDITCPMGVYGRSKLEGEQAVLRAHSNAMIFRTSWLYSAFGSNFLITMLRLARSRPDMRVVDDQHGCPTSAHDLAVALLDVASNVLDGGCRPGIYHLSGTGGATWYGLTTKIFAQAKACGRHVPSLAAITTADYPTPARRPANSVLDCTKIDRELGIKLRPWPDAVADCVSRIVENEELQRC